MRLSVLCLIFGQVVGIESLDGIVPATGITTAALGHRHADDLLELPPGIRIQTRCRASWCVDGVSAGKKVLVAPTPSAEEARVYRGGGAWLERVIRVAWSSDSYVSIYLAESEFSGGAHANNTFSCRTFDTKTGRALRLRDVLPAASAERILRKLRPLLAEPGAWVEVLRDAPPHGYSVDERSFRIGRSDAARGPGLEIILCAEGAYPSLSGTILEIPLDAIPTRYLLDR